jgi:hypothetical protein
VQSLLQTKDRPPELSDKLHSAEYRPPTEQQGIGKTF